jgi:hypothetical protein
MSAVTQRQWQIATLIALGLTNARMSAELGLTSGTVATTQHLRQQFVTSINQMFAIAEYYHELASQVVDQRCRHMSRSDGAQPNGDGDRARQCVGSEMPASSTNQELSQYMSACCWTIPAPGVSFQFRKRRPASARAPPAATAPRRRWFGPKSASSASLPVGRRVERFARDLGDGARADANPLCQLLLGDFGKASVLAQPLAESGRRIVRQHSRELSQKRPLVARRYRCCEIALARSAWSPPLSSV